MAAIGSREPDIVAFPGQIVPSSSPVFDLHFQSPWPIGGMPIAVIVFGQVENRLAGKVHFVGVQLPATIEANFLAILEAIACGVLILMGFVFTTICASEFGFHWSVSPCVLIVGSSIDKPNTLVK